MNRTYLIASAALIAVASTAVIATAHDKGEGPGRYQDRGGPAMMFERFDTDDDGAITKAEIEAAAAARFTEADANGDGLLSAEEMTAAAEARRAERRGKRMARGSERMIERHDADGDGMLSLEEMTAEREGRGIEHMFEQIDADGDGVITKAEVEQMRGKFGRRMHGRGHN